MYRYKEMDDWTFEEFECWKHVPRRMKRNKNISLDEKLFYGALASLADKDGVVTLKDNGITETITLLGGHGSEH